MGKTGLILLGGGATIAVVAGVVIATRKPPTSKPPTSPTPSSTPSPLSSIKLYASATSASAGATITFTAVAYNSDGKAMQGVSISLVETNTNQTVGSGTTNSSGSYQKTVTFSDAGTYSFIAEAN